MITARRFDNLDGLQTTELWYIMYDFSRLTSVNDILE